MSGAAQVDQMESDVGVEDDISYMSASELAIELREREVSSREVMLACIDRIEARNPALNAFTYTAFDEALATADARDRQLVSGASIGALHGVPTAIKDLFGFYPGWVETMGGIPSLRDYRTRVKSAWAEKVEQAGAIIIGKTNSPVLGFRGTCDNPLFGATRNPFDVRYNAGGSSGGAAAAVADGLLPFAEGTDGGGSIRIPAAWCGLFGFKQTFGRTALVTRPDAFAGTSPFLFEGVLTRTVADAALWLDAVAGHDARDPLSAPATGRYGESLRMSVRGLKVAWSPTFGGFPVEPRVKDAVAQAVRAFADAGAIVEASDYRLPYDQHELSDLWCRMIASVMLDALARLRVHDGIDLLGQHSEELPEDLRCWLEVCRSQTFEERARDRVMRTAVLDSLIPVLSRYDLLVTPTLACQPVLNRTPRGATVGPASVNGVTVDEQIGWCLGYPLNFTGHPAASVPVGTIEELPVGMQLIGRHWEDSVVLAAAATFERMRPWRHLYARCRARR